MKNLTTIFSKPTKLFLILSISFATLFLPLTSLQAATLTNGMDATYVLGQSDFTTNTIAQTATGMKEAGAVVVDSTNNRVFVAMYDRIMVYSTVAHENGQAATAVLGQDTMTGTKAVATDASSVSAPLGLAYDADGQRLFVSDTRNHRILVFDVASITNGESAAYVLGQANFASGQMNRGGVTAINSLANPEGLAYDADSDLLYVADPDNSRVLIFNVASITNGEDAVNVLGQSNFTAYAQTTTVSGLNQAADLSLDGAGTLFVADKHNNRVLMFDVTAITNGENAVNVLGAGNFTTSSGGASISLFSLPSSVSYQPETGHLFVFDSFGPRLLIFDLSSGTTNGMNASYVLGQPDFDSATANWGGSLVSDGRGGFVSGPGQSGFAGGPTKIFINDSTSLLYVAESGNNRVMIFDLNATAVAASSSTTNSFTIPPLCTATLTPSTITKGEQSTLSWNIKWPTDRQSIYYTKIPKNGLYSDRVSSITISPTHTTTYRIATFNLWGANFCESTITVLNEQGEELTSPKNTLLSAGAGNSPFAKAILNFFRSIFSR